MSSRLEFIRFNLIKVVQSSMQVGQHACGWLVSDFDGIFQNSLWNDVFLWSGRGFCTHEHSVVLVTVLTATFEKLLKTSQPLCHQVNVLERNACKCIKQQKYRAAYRSCTQRHTCKMTQWPSLEAFSMASSATDSWPCPRDTLWSFPRSIVKPSFLP